MICPSCGADNPPDQDECEDCGEALYGFPAPPARDADYLDPPVVVPKMTPTRKPRPSGVRQVPQVPEEREPRSLLGPRYELIARLGEGATGTVYHARDLKLDEDIAIKVLKPTLTQDSASIERFKTELITARRITHPNVIRIHDFGETEHDVFISMELLTGGTLAQRVAAGRMPLAEAVRIGVGLAEGLAAAHQQEIIHRDLNPSNVLFNDNEDPKIGDFGIARLASMDGSLSGAFGTPHYMSPEQANASEVTRATDLYSLGVILYELTTGRRPFRSESLSQLALAHLSERPPRPRAIRPDVPRLLEDAILKAMEKRPERRWASAVELATALHQVALGL